MYYDYGYNDPYSVDNTAVIGMFLAICGVIILISIFTLICNWKVLKKAGKGGWECLIPIYNNIVLLEITKLPMWYIVLYFIPVANIIVLFLVYIELAKKFGRSDAFGVGLVFLNPIFMAILAFNKNCVYSASMSVNNQTYQQTNYSNQSQFTSGIIQNNACSRCGSPMNPGDRFCTSCGTAINEIAQSSNCSTCGATINSGDKFCMNCGKQL